MHKKPKHFKNFYLAYIFNRSFLSTAFVQDYIFIDTILTTLVYLFYYLLIKYEYIHGGINNMT